MTPRDKANVADLTDWAIRPTRPVEVISLNSSNSYSSKTEESRDISFDSSISSPREKETRRPECLNPAALHGVAGEYVELVEPHTEAGVPAILTQFLAVSGVFLGRTSYYQVEADSHYGNLFISIVGNTSGGRKGTSLGQVLRVFKLADGEFVNKCRKGGLSSGEGLIWSVRDPIRTMQPVKEKGRIVTYEETIEDHGIFDKRLLVTEPEFARLLQVTQRDTNTLSAIIREAWDTGSLNILTKAKTATASGAHIGIVCHITSDELKRLLTTTEAANGFANRFIWVHAERSKELPHGGNLPDEQLLPIADCLRKAQQACQGRGRLAFDQEARTEWERVYGALSAGKPGLFGSVTARAAPQVCRLALVYALLDCDTAIRIKHLKAALAVWTYAEESARYIFGDAIGDQTADTILSFLQTTGQVGATRTEVSNLFHRNKGAEEIDRALRSLQKLNRAYAERDPSNEGRPVERWFFSTMATN
jgi:Protein of unknown function (DUF3987)